MSHVSHRLNSALQGALAGGGDPATSPLYVFGPFLRLITVSGAGALAFGTPIWMVVATVCVVSLMYRHVMHWVPDGSGGSGLCEEEFGGWAVKVNASITAIEYTLTFLVSVAALVTFIADRVGGLGRAPRTLIAVALTALVAFVVNRGPRLAARVFGPATAAVLVLLWVLVGAVIIERGITLPSFSLHAFDGANVKTTLAGYVRLLALMTGIEVFANLVAAYDGPPTRRAHMAFNSLLIVMVSTLVMMVIVGPAIFAIADPAREDVSVFTQTMDALLPAPVAYVGTLVGIVVLLSAAAASAQGLQNLALGLRHRHYVPAQFGLRNRFDVADRPAIGQAIVVAGCFVLFGTHEETYLTLYAAGVFVLLGLTGWASVKRLWRERLESHSGWPALLGTAIAAAITSVAAALIFAERFLEGAWAYGVLVPVLYFVLSRYRRNFGPPSKLSERLGRKLGERKSFVDAPVVDWPENVCAVLDGGQVNEAALIAGGDMAAVLSSRLSLCLVGESGKREDSRADYASTLTKAFALREPPLFARDTTQVQQIAKNTGVDMLVVTDALDGLRELSHVIDTPMLRINAKADQHNRYPKLSRVIVALDGSAEAEVVLPYAAQLIRAGASVDLVVVPEGDAEDEAPLKEYGTRAAKELGDRVNLLFGGSGPSRTIEALAHENAVDLIVVGTHGRGGVARAAHVPLGSVPEKLLADAPCAVLLVPSRAP